MQKKYSNRFLAAKKYILMKIRSALSKNTVDGVEEVTSALLKCEKIFVYGVGRSGLIGKAFAMRLVQLGLSAYFIGETTTPIVTSRDTVVIISRTGETYSALQTANIVRRVGANLIALTDRKGSKLAHAANIVLYVSPNYDKKSAEFAPLGTLFEISALITLDALISEIMARKRETEDSMRARHPIWV